MTPEEIFEKGISPFLPLEGLIALKEAIETDSDELLQGETVEGTYQGKIAGCCAIAYTGWYAGFFGPCEDAIFYLDDRRAEADERLGIEDATDQFIAWYDDIPRVDLQTEFLPVVERCINERLRLRNGASTSPVSAENAPSPPR